MPINKATRKDDGRQVRVPMKLEKGMAVVVWIKPGFPLMSWEMGADIKEETWLKGILNKVTSDGWYSASIKGERIVFSNKEAIIIRSTALADNLKPNKQRRHLASQAKQQRKEILASVKVVRSEVR
jgi:hypothetical protein